MDNRVLELAIETLEKKKADIDAEIVSLQVQLKGGIQVSHPAVAVQKRRRSRTPAQRRRHSEVMKTIWAARKAKAAKTIRARKTATPKPKRGPQSAAAKEAVSKRMKAYWKKRKAAEGRK